MNGVNLIPAARRAASGRARVAKLWSIVVASLAAVVGLGHAVLWNAWQPVGEDPAPELSRLSAAIVAGQKSDRAAKAKLVEVKATSAASREIADQPDWGVLLTYLAGTLGDDAALDSVHLSVPAAVEASAGKGSKPPGSRSGRRTLVLTGMAGSQESASSVAIELRGSGLFDEVALAETRRTDYMGAKAVAFRIECAISGAGGGD
jgi:hypothetical protein